MYNFRLDLRLSCADIAKKLKLPVRSITVMENRGTVKPSFLRSLEKIYGDCTNYLILKSTNTK